MENHPEARLLRIFIGESNKVGSRPLYEAIAFEAKKQGLCGATVTRGVMGFGANSQIHTPQLLELSWDLPMIVEIVDTEEKVRAFAKIVEQLIETSTSGGLITLEKAEILRYQPGK